MDCPYRCIQGVLWWFRRVSHVTLYTERASATFAARRCSNLTFQLASYWSKCYWPAVHTAVQISLSNGAEEVVVRVELSADDDGRPEYHMSYMAPAVLGLYRLQVM